MRSVRWRARARGLSVVAALALAAAGASPAAAGVGRAAGPGWRLGAGASQEAAAATLSGVSCLSASSCTAAGDHVSPAGINQTLVERWDGTRWSVVPSPSRAAPSFLTGVSCSSATACAAVGYVATATANGTRQVAALAEIWNGRAWSVAPVPGAAGAQLTAVSCVSARACTAVGGGQGGPLAVRWDGSSWRRQADSFAGGSLASVSCVSVTFCVAVGAAGQSPLAQSWDGRAWTAMPGSAGVHNPLTGVSCTAATWCVAVSAHGSESWDGSSWTAHPLPHATSLSLAGVSCVSAAFCVAAGQLDTGLLTIVPVAAAWDGSRWRLEAPVNPAPGTTAILSAVTCTAAAACQAVGTSLDRLWDSRALAEARTRGWSLEPAASPAGAITTELTAVSCPAPSACWAAGYTVRGPGLERAVAERWDGRSWAVVPVPHPRQQSALYGMSCTSPSACTAVGESYGTAGTAAPLAERWDGTSWIVQAVPDPGRQATLTAVSCWSAAGCTAVGHSVAASGSLRTLAETQNGGAWSVRRTPDPAGAAVSELTGVSCTAAAACAAVGESATAALGLRWDGRTWRLTVLPAASGSSYVLDGVSCTAPLACAAVGWSYGTPGYRPLAASLAGPGWTLRPVRDPVAGGRLSAVSCTPAGCAAAGSDAAGALTESRSRGGAWSRQAAAQPRGGYRPALAGVSCGPGGQCTAVGAFSPYADGLNVSLAERRA